MSTYIHTRLIRLPVTFRFISDNENKLNESHGGTSREKRASSNNFTFPHVINNKQESSASKLNACCPLVSTTRIVCPVDDTRPVDIIIILCKGNSVNEYIRPSSNAEWTIQKI
jgi:hypothetical protein